MYILKISSKSEPNKVAGAIAGIIEQRGKVELQVVGAGALNQAIKSIAVAREYLAPSRIDLVCIPEFVIVTIEGEEKTGIKLIVKGE